MEKAEKLHQLAITMARQLHEIRKCYKISTILKTNFHSCNLLFFSTVFRKSFWCCGITYAVRRVGWGSIPEGGSGNGFIR